MNQPASETPQPPVRETSRGWLRRFIGRCFPVSPPPGWEIVTDGKHYRWRRNGSLSMFDRATYWGACRAAWCIHRNNKREAEKNWQLVSPPNRKDNTMLPAMCSDAGSALFLQIRRGEAAEKEVRRLTGICERLEKEVAEYSVRAEAAEKKYTFITRKAQELEIVLDAWHSQFGTSRLSHASARLEKAERDVQRLTAYKDEIHQKMKAVVEAARETERMIHHAHDVDCKVSNNALTTLKLRAALADLQE